jgi:alkylated DNA repair dioxygenase AlkB
MTSAQPALFDTPPVLPEGMRYRPELITAAEEQALSDRFAALPFQPFEFQGYFGKRRVVFYGYRYDFTEREVQRVAPIPDFLLPVRERAAAFAGLEPEALEHALINEYQPGAPIGWHRDRPQFGDVLGVSLLSPCRFRLRRKTGARWERMTITLEPRSAYLLRGPARSEWEHSIPEAEALRYSITFRTLR